jgi:hypothetical protein
MRDVKGKGRKGEHEVARLLGGKRAPLSGAVGGMGDVVIPLSGIFGDWIVEVKRRKKLGGVSLQAALYQAEAGRSVGDRRKPMVVAREDHGEWYVFCRADDLVGWASALAEVGNGQQIKTLLRQASSIMRDVNDLL